MTSNRPSITVFAGTNIALVKYWGKRDKALNLPATGSLSLTLANLGSETTVCFDAGHADESGKDSVFLDGSPAPESFANRVHGFLDLIRDRADLRLPALVRTANSVPTAAGLASSAAGFAALALAASKAAGLSLTDDELSELARRGSGSAARSIVGGFALMSAGSRADGKDAIARPILDPGAWDVRLVVAMTATGQKAIGSSQAMELTARTSPYYPAWVASVDRDLEDARAAILDRDLDRLGLVAERSAMRMHASAMAADPHVLYWNPGTLAAMGAVKALRAGKLSAYFTIDAGPHVKVLCAGKDAELVERTLAGTPGVLRTLSLSPGPGARILGEPAA